MGWSVVVPGYMSDKSVVNSLRSRHLYIVQVWLYINIPRWIASRTEFCRYTMEDIIESTRIKRASLSSPIETSSCIAVSISFRNDESITSSGNFRPDILIDRLCPAEKTLEAQQSGGGLFFPLPPFFSPGKKKTTLLLQNFQSHISSSTHFTRSIDGGVCGSGLVWRIRSKTPTHVLHRNIRNRHGTDDRIEFPIAWDSILDIPICCDLNNNDDSQIFVNVRIFFKKGQKKKLNHLKSTFFRMHTHAIQRNNIYTVCACPQSAIGRVIGTIS